MASPSDGSLSFSEGILFDKSAEKSGVNPMKTPIMKNTDILNRAFFQLIPFDFGLSKDLACLLDDIVAHADFRLLDIRTRSSEATEISRPLIATYVCE